MFRMRVLSTIVLCGLLSLNSCDQPKGEAVVDTWKPAPPPRRAEAPPETSLTPTRDPQAETTVQIVDRTHTLAGVNLRLADLISVAYRTPESPKSVMPLLSAVRVISPTPLAEQHYDVRIYLPRASAEQLRAELRRLLQERFGLTAHREPREADVLVLQLLYDQLRPNPNAELEGTAANRITVPELADENELRQALERAFDYRGDVLITRKDGTQIEGYIFDRRPGRT